MRTLLELCWTNRRLALLSVVALAAGAGALSAWLTPRGPLTTFQALTTMMAALMVGFLAGLIMKSRWSAILAAAVFIAVFELGRLNLSGPTVDKIMLDNIYGVIALISGRFVHWILAVLPMVVGAFYGTWIGGRLSLESSQSMGVFGWVFTALASALLVLAVFTIAKPASTHAILGPDGEPLPGSVSELIEVPVGGTRQTLMVRGRDKGNPVLLYLAGGPGGTDLGAMRDDVSLEAYFVVVTWDQRGTGKSYASIDPVETLTTERMISDTIEITNYLRSRFDEEKIYLVGNSWGTILGTLAIQERPDLYHAYVGTGQMVSPRETDIMFYEDTLKWAEQTGQHELVDSLEQIGAPPYEDLLLYEAIINHEHDWNPYPGMDASKEMPFNTFVPENNLMDRVNAMRGLLDTYSVLYPQIQQLDLRVDVPVLEVPVYIVMGRYEARGRATPAAEWFENLAAPYKEEIVFENSGHRPPFEEPARFTALMKRVVEETYPGK